MCLLSMPEASTPKALVETLIKDFTLDYPLI